MMLWNLQQELYFRKSGRFTKAKKEKPPRQKSAATTAEAAPQATADAKVATEQTATPHEPTLLEKAVKWLSEK